MSGYNNLNNVPQYGDAPPQYDHQHYDQVALAWASAPPPSYNTVYGGDLESDNAVGLDKDHNEGGGGGVSEQDGRGRSLSSLDPERDFAEMSRLRRKLCRLSIMMFVVNLSGVLVGSLVFHRTVGPYSIGNFVTLGCFLVGTVAFWSDGNLATRGHQRFGANVYYAFVWLAGIGGVAAGIYYLVTVPDRVDALCDGDQFEEQCTDNRGTLKQMAMLAAAGGVVLWVLLFAIMARVCFVYMCAIERAHGAESAADIFPLVTYLALSLPDFHYYGRELGDACRGAAAYICVGTTIAFLVVSFVFCVVGYPIFCLIYDLLYLILLIMFDSD